MPGYQAFSFTRRASAATAELLLCPLTENVGVIPLFSCLEIRFCQLFAWYISRIPFLYYAVHFLASLCQKKSKQNVNSANQLSVWSWCSRQRRPHCVRAFVTIEIGAKNEVLDPVYPLPCLLSWSKPLSYRKLPTITVINAIIIIVLINACYGYSQSSSIASGWLGWVLRYFVSQSEGSFRER